MKTSALEHYRRCLAADTGYFAAAADCSNQTRRLLRHCFVHGHEPAGAFRMHFGGEGEELQAPRGRRFVHEKKVFGQLGEGQKVYYQSAFGACGSVG